MLHRLRLIALLIAALAICAPSCYGKLQAVGGAAPQVAQYELSTIEVPFPMNSTPISGIGVMFLRNASNASQLIETLAIASRGVGAAQVAHFHVANKSVAKVVGAADGRTGCSTADNNYTLNASSAISPTTVVVLESNTILAVDAMPGARLLQISTGSPSVPFSPEATRVMAIVGRSYCSYDQPSFTPGARAYEPIAPISYAYYLAQRAELYLSLYGVVVVVKNDRVLPFFGANNSEPGSRLDVFNENATHRLNATTQSPGQLQHIGDTLYVPEGGMLTVRAISLTTGIATILLGNLSQEYRWPPPECSITSPCAFNDLFPLRPTALAAYVDTITGGNVLLLGDATTGVVWRADLATREVYEIAGRMLHPGRHDGPVNVSELWGVRQFAPGRDGLYITDGRVRFLALPSNLKPVHLEPPRSALCNVFDHCNGRATAAFGLPAVNCTCVCKSGWAGNTCDVREPWNIATRSVSSSTSATPSTSGATHSPSTTATEVLPTPAPTTTAAPTAAPAISTAAPTTASVAPPATTTTTAAPPASTTTLPPALTTATDATAVPPPPPPTTTGALPTPAPTTAAPQPNTTAPEPPTSPPPTPVPTAEVPKGQATATTTAATSSVAVSVVAGASGGGAAADMQGILAIGLTTCAGGMLNQLSKDGRRALLPLADALGDFKSSPLVGSIVLAAGVIFLHFCFTAMNVKGPRFAEARHRTRFPSLSWAFFNLLYQGIVLESFRLIFDADSGPGDRVLGAFVAALCVALPVVATIWSKNNLHRCAYFVYDHSKRNVILRTFLYPAGFWDPEDAMIVSMKAIGGMVAGPGRWMFAGLSQIRTLLVGVIVAVPTFAHCTLQAVLLAIVFLGYAILICAFRPYRMRGTMLGNVLMSVVSGLVAISLVSDVLDSMGAALLTMASGVSVLSVILVLVCIFLERYWKDNEMVAVSERIGGREESSFVDENGSFVRANSTPTAGAGLNEENLVTNGSLLLTAEDRAALNLRTSPSNPTGDEFAAHHNNTGNLLGSGRANSNSDRSPTVTANTDNPRTPLANTGSFSIGRGRAQSTVSATGRHSRPASRALPHRGSDLDVGVEFGALAGIVSNMSISERPARELDDDPWTVSTNAGAPPGRSAGTPNTVAQPQPPLRSTPPMPPSQRPVVGFDDLDDVL